MVTLSQQLVSSLVLYAIVLSLLSAFMALLVRDMLYAVAQLARSQLMRPLFVYLLKLQRLRRAYGLSYSQAHRLVKLLKSTGSTKKALELLGVSQ